MCAAPNTKAYGRLTVMIQCQCDVHSLLTVEPTAFKPAPKVMSKIVRLVPFAKPLYHIEDLLLLQHITTEAFNQRRKMIQNALKAYLTQTDFDRLSLNPQLRPEALSVQDFVKISNYVSNKT
jgi:16S rRNA (adenine1518-N6/adenine1519-N6)-dimethyltransferase